MATTKTTKAAPITTTTTESIGIWAGEAIDGHIDLINGFNSARHPTVVEHRAAKNQQRLDALIAAQLAE